MGKRKRSSSKIRRKIRRLEKKLRECPSSSDDEEYDRCYRASALPEPASSQSESSDDDIQIRSWVEPTTLPDVATEPLAAPLEQQSANCSEPIASVQNSDAEILCPEILQAIGDPVGKEEVLGPAVSEELAKRWGKILIDGMTKEAKEALLKSTLIPENFCLAKAPKLNSEILAIISDTTKIRDKHLENSQNYLGLGIASLANLASTLIREDLNKIETLKRVSDVSQILMDLHSENTKHRRKLITSSLDKKFSSAISDVKRDAFLFGSDLGERIKATKTAEKSGLQIKRAAAIPSTSKLGNWKGPPRSQQTKPYKRGGLRPKQINQAYASQRGRRPPFPTNRSQPPPKSDGRNRRNP